PAHQPPVHFVHFHVGEGFILGAVGDPIGQALLALRNRRAEILVEYFDGFDPWLAEPMNPTDDLPGGEFTIDHDCNVSFDGRKTWKRLGDDSARSILKQFLQVKFEHQRRRHAELLGAIGVKLAEVAEPRLVHARLGGFSGMEKFRAGALPARRLAQAEKLEHRLDGSLGLEKSHGRLVAGAQSSARQRAVQQSRQDRMFLRLAGRGAEHLAQVKSVKALRLAGKIQAQVFDQPGNETHAELAVFARQRIEHGDRRGRPEAGKLAVGLFRNERQVDRFAQALAPEQRAQAALPAHAEIDFRRDPDLRQSGRQAVVAAQPRDFLDQIRFAREIGAPGGNDDPQTAVFGLPLGFQTNSAKQLFGLVQLHRDAQQPLDPFLAQAQRLRFEPAGLPPAISWISFAARSSAAIVPSGSTPRSKRCDASLWSASRLAVRRMTGGAKLALSSRIARVEAVTSESSPPITPASATGVSPSQTSRSSGASSLSTPSRVVNFLTAPARRTRIFFRARRSRSKACSGWPVSSMT